MSNSQFSHDCPHCGSKGAAFEVVYERPTRKGDGKSVLTSVCGVCDGPVLVKFRQIRGTSRAGLVGQKRDFPGDLFQILEFWPPTGGSIPDSLPANIAAFFNQGVSNEKAGNWDAAGAMFRKALDVATKTLEPALANKTMFDRINALAKAGKLTADVATWAHEVRIDGNRAVHDDDPETPEDVAAMHEFCRAVLLYSFTLPALVASRSTKPA